MNFKEKAIGGGKKYDLEVIDGKINGLELMEKDLDALKDEKSTAIEAKAKAETERDTIKAEADAVRKALETDCTNFGKLIGEEPKAEDLAKLNLKGLFDLHESIMAKQGATATEKAHIYTPTEAY